MEEETKDPLAKQDKLQKGFSFADHIGQENSPKLKFQGSISTCLQVWGLKFQGSMNECPISTNHI